MYEFMIRQLLAKLKTLQTIQKDLHFPILRAVGLGSFITVLVGGCLIYSNSRAYWETRKRVQTVDFHILFHQLPYKLSALVINGNKQELQRLINSSNGFFGIVVTDCNSKNPSCEGEKILYSTIPKERWSIPRSNELFKQPYDLLKDPPPILTEQVFNSPKDKSSTYIKQSNPGKIIGRAYYIRGKYNNPIEDIEWWIKSGLFKDSGSAPVLLSSTIISLLLSTSSVLGIEITLLIRKKSKERIEQVQNELNLVIGREASIADENRSLSYRLEDRTHQLQEAQSQIKGLQKLDPENEALKYAHQQLSQVLESVKSEKNAIQEKAIQWEKFAEELKGIAPQEALIKMTAYDEIQKEKRTDNEFEQKILDYLASSKQVLDKEWVISAGVDLGFGNQPRAQTDIIISTKRSVIVLEAKCYWGKITTQGSRNEAWFSDSYRINKGQNKNPYRQVCDYTDQARNRLRPYLNSSVKVPVFGLVVFPDRADVDDLSEQLGEYYDVSTLEKLIDKIITFDDRSGNDDQIFYTPEHLDKILKGQIDLNKLQSNSCKEKIIDSTKRNEAINFLEKINCLIKNSYNLLQQQNKDYTKSGICNIDSSKEEKNQDLIVELTNSFKLNSLEEWTNILCARAQECIDVIEVKDQVLNILKSTPLQDSISFKLIAAKVLQDNHMLNNLISEIGSQQKNISNLEIRCECITKYFVLVVELGNNDEKQKAFQRCSDWIQFSPELVGIQENLIQFYLRQANNLKISSFLSKFHSLLNSQQPLSQAECKALFLIIQNLESVSQSCRIISLTLERLLEFREISGVWEPYINLVKQRAGKNAQMKLEQWLNSDH